MNDLRATLISVGLAPKEAGNWENLIQNIADRASVQEDKVSLPILQTLAVDRLSVSNLNQIDELGLKLSGVFERILGKGFKGSVSRGEVTGDMLGMALTVLMAADEYQNMVETED